MNKWFASARDLSDSESSESSDEDTKKTVTQQQPTAAAGKKAPAKRNYMKGFEDSEESEDEQRVVKTGRDKKLDHLNGMIKDINNHLKINDFSSLMNDFEKFTEEIERDPGHADSVIYIPGTDNEL
jgi:translation initiation factor 3 subunit C